MGFEIIQTIKKVALETINEHALQVLFGKVKTVEPLVIKVGDMFDLTQEYIVLDSPVEVDEEVVVIKYSTCNKYLILSTVEKVYQSTGNNGGTDVELNTNDGTWTTCTASAYGDREIGNSMANGETLTSTSMTVAVPMGSYYKKYKNKRLLISYNGKTVTAKVTDCGNFGEGNKYTNRQMDLAPGIWKAFGFTTPQQWGLRTIQYKYVD